MIKRRETLEVKVGSLTIGSGSPIRIQSMSDSPTEDVERTVDQLLQLYSAGAELLRVTVNNDDAAKSVFEIKKVLNDKGCNAPLIGDFHYNGHILLRKYKKCAEALDKYRINPGNTGVDDYRKKHFLEILKIASDYDKPIRIGVNSGSVDQDILENLRKKKKNLSERDLLIESMVISAEDSLKLALDNGFLENKIILSAKTTDPIEQIKVYRELAKRTKVPFHIGLTESGGGIKGIVWSSVALGILLFEGLGDTIRVSITPKPDGDRREEVYVAKEILQSLSLRDFTPKLISCPGCGRTNPNLFRYLVASIEEFILQNSERWLKEKEGVEKLKIAVMGCIVNGIGEGKHADIGISLPGKGENLIAVVFEKGREKKRIRGNKIKIVKEFKKEIEDFVKNFKKKES